MMAESTLLAAEALGWNPDPGGSAWENARPSGWRADRWPGQHKKPLKINKQNFSNRFESVPNLKG